ncbi:hypothetical protein [Leptolyngbya sp. 7M]|uniref:hypothetical protein n=1 Tax=Leptolyngbya sp. 7M TaxID=2812896 RepID=UPI001B8CE681|nr:hypothetical protein [Leptolyngbya sp. 7M]QYO64956.1 hypothetical protein JVX88_36430 [Leptolyngbya sp. 7M]
MGRVLRKGSADKFAVLYEVVAEETTEEGVSRRRQPQSRQRQPLEPGPSPYQMAQRPMPRAAEAAGDWGEPER